MQDSTKVLLGATRSSFKVIDNRAGTIPAGTAVRLKSDGTISVASADGNLLGVSVGADLGYAGRTAICRMGLDVPILLTAAFTPVVGAQVNISNTTGLAGAAGAGFTAVNAVYKSAVLTGVKEDATEADCALIDFQGGL